MDLEQSKEILKKQIEHVSLLYKNGEISQEKLQEYLVKQDARHMLRMKWYDNLDDAIEAARDSYKDSYK